jgi:hypothetical protein
MVKVLAPGHCIFEFIDTYLWARFFPVFTGINLLTQFFTKNKKNEKANFFNCTFYNHDDRR